MRGGQSYDSHMSSLPWRPAQTDSQGSPHWRTHHPQELLPQLWSRWREHLRKRPPYPMMGKSRGWDWRQIFPHQLQWEPGLLQSNRQSLARFHMHCFIVPNQVTVSSIHCSESVKKGVTFFLLKTHKIIQIQVKLWRIHNLLLGLLLRKC